MHITMVHHSFPMKMPCVPMTSARQRQKKNVSRISVRTCIGTDPKVVRVTVFRVTFFSHWRAYLPVLFPSQSQFAGARPCTRRVLPTRVPFHFVLITHVHLHHTQLAHMRTYTVYVSRCTSYTAHRPRNCRTAGYPSRRPSGNCVLSASRSSCSSSASGRSAQSALL